EGVLPVLPEPLAVETRVEVVPRQDLDLVALTQRVPVEVDGLVGQRLVRARGPPLVGEVLAPAVEAAAVLPHRADDLADPAVAARQQTLHDGGLALVVA